MASANRNTRTRKTRTRNATPAEKMFSSVEVAAIVASAASAAALGMAGIAQNGVSTQSSLGDNSGSNATGTSTGNVRSIASAPRKRSTSNSTGTGRPGRKITEDSGLNRARQMYQQMLEQNKDVTRKEVVAAFKQPRDKGGVGLKPDIANTYYHVVAGKKTGTSRGRRKSNKGGSAAQTAAAASA